MMAKSLDELLRIKGVIAAGEFAPNGKLLGFRSKGTPLPGDVVLLTDPFAAEVNQMLDALAAAYGWISGADVVPGQRWIYSGGDLTIAVDEGLGVVAKTAKADFNQLFTALIEPRQVAGIGERPHERTVYV